MATEGEPPQGGHELDFGSGSQDPTPPPAAAPEHAFPPPGQPDAPQPDGGQPGQAAPALPAAPQPGQPYGAQPAAPYGAQPGQPGQPYSDPSTQPYAGQPYPAQQPYGAQPGQPYPAQQPYGAQPGQPYAGQPYAGQPNGPQPPKKSSKGLLWGLIGGGVVVLIAVVLVVALLVVPAISRSSATAADAVKGYLTAVSKSDAKTALGYLESVPNKDLLTDEVLKESNKLAPLGHITVAQGKDSSYSSEVAATFTIGDKKIVTTYHVYKTKDVWKVGNGVQPISLSVLQGLDATINGVSTAKLTEPYVFPGTYALALTSKYFSFDGDSTFTIANDTDSSALYDVKTTLNDAGVTEFRSLVRTAVEGCIAMKTLATPCGMDITSIDLSGATAVEGTVTRTLTADGSATLDALEPESNGSSPTVVSAYDYVSVDMALQGSDGQTYTVTFGGSLDTPTVDFGAADPKVVWEQ